MYLKKVKKIFFISTAFTVLLFLIKIISGYFFKSNALIYDGLESLADLLLFAILYGAAVIAEKPADDEHLYGHTKLESLASLYLGLAIASGGFYLLYRSVSTILQKTYVKPSSFAFLIAVLTVATKEILYFYTLKSAKSTSSPVLFALAVDHHKDALSSLVTVAGTAGGAFNYPVLDPAAATVTAAVIIIVGLNTIFSSSSDLLDRSPEKSVVEDIQRTILETEGVEEITSLKARKSGRSIYVDVDICVNRELPVTEAHEIATLVKNRIKDKIENVKDVVVHVEPKL